MIAWKMSNELTIIFIIMNADDPDSDIFLQQFDFEQPIAKISPKKEIISSVPLPDFYQLDQTEPASYLQAKPFKIQFPRKPDPPGRKTNSVQMSSSQHYSNQEFDSLSEQVKTSQKAETIVKQLQDHPIFKTGSETRQQSRIVFNSEAHQSEQKEPENSTFKKKKIAAKSNQPNKKSQSTPKKTFSKIPYFGLFMKRHIYTQNPENNKQHKLIEMKSSNSPSKLCFKQIMELSSSLLQTFQEPQIERLNKILLDRLKTYDTHHKQIQKEKSYILSNELVHKLFLNRKKIKKQRLKIENIQNLMTRQSKQYSDSLNETSQSLKEKYSSLYNQVKKLTSIVGKNEYDKKIFEKRQQLKMEVSSMKDLYASKEKQGLAYQVKQHQYEIKIQQSQKKLSKINEQLGKWIEKARLIIQQHRKIHPKKEAQQPRYKSTSRSKEVLQNRVCLSKKSLIRYPRGRHSTINNKYINTEQQSSSKDESSLTQQIYFQYLMPNQLKMQSQIVNPSETNILNETNTQNMTEKLQPNSAVNHLLQIKMIQKSDLPLSFQNKKINTSQQNNQCEITQQKIQISPIKDHLQSSIVRPFLIKRRIQTKKQEKTSIQINSDNNSNQLTLNEPIKQPKSLGRNRFHQRYSSQPSQSYLSTMSFASPPSKPRCILSKSTSIIQSALPQTALPPSHTRRSIRYLNANEILSIAEVEEPDNFATLNLQTNGKVVQSTPIQNTNNTSRFRRKFQLRNANQDEELEVIPISKRTQAKPAWLLED